MKEDLKNYIGIFDSGCGGISVLKECQKLLPNENFYYYGDSKHAPYGDKSVKEVQDRVFQTVNYMVNKGCKAIVIACNTATSITIDLLRDVFDLPIIGVEPALKPATIDYKKILVLATNNTLKLDKFHELTNNAKENTVIPLGCPGLPELIEEGHINDDKLNQYLEDLLLPYKDTIDSVVLGCTHYPLIKEAILNVLGDIPCFDGGEGTAKQLKRKLEEINALNDNEGLVIFKSSKENQENLYKELFLK